MLHIIGLHHRAQARTPRAEETAAQRAFVDRLNRTIREFGPVFIAEEDSEDSLALRHQTSIAQRIAAEKGIEHRFCDPDREQRRALGYWGAQDLEQQMHIYNDEGLSHDDIHLKAGAIEIGRYFPIRERFWFERLGGCRERAAIFICGNGHVETFTGLLDGEGIRSRIAERGIGVTKEEEADRLRIVDYLRTHPELRKYEPDFSKGQ